jgi:hypothetical protein
MQPRIVAQMAVRAHTSRRPARGMAVQLAFANRKSRNA